MTQPAQPRRPKLRRDAEEKRERIVEAARRLVAESGIDAGRELIARSADVGLATVYRRFPNLDALYYEVFADQLAAVRALIDETAAIEDPWIALTQFIERSCELLRDNRGLQAFLHGRLPEDEGPDDRTRILPAVERLVDRAREAGKVRDDLGTGDIAVLFAVTGTLIEAFRTVDPDLYQRYLTVFLDGIKRGHRAPTLPAAAPTSTQLDDILKAWQRD
ncbi:TetR/AcrR family transcriptional regulator [Streptomyces sp. NPDC096311]|uniref:TetR/AcrR family transcriptional regulator n=1 Tax=Streptomyces sp. NPDC096311 TaxID=3366083 RepID=UPI003811E464